MSDKMGWCIVLFILFMIHILFAGAFIYDHVHRKNPCEYCYFEKAYDANGNQKFIYKGCKR
jgi:disulfide bond formation protein DsbB